MQRKKLVNQLTELLKPFQINDYCPNGLQVEGKDEIKKVVTGVTASQALIDAAIDKQADAILVHHGYFWKGEDQTITGMKQRRIKRLLEHDINLLAYHLPLDVHPELGNNAQLGELLNLTVERPLEPWNKNSVAVKGKLKTPMSVDEFSALIEQKLDRKPLVNKAGDHKIKTIAWCTGGGQSFIDLAASQGIDAYLTGEASEQTIHSSTEQGIHFFAAGHHATERYGVKALGEYLADKYDLDVEFIDIHNPV
ncbi:Nif3-like dinuclear metal center hexameric protein [Pseudoalteromonas luteoviolacea]|uniref:Nif3-like dinuclear metal center hexameric protein n=1 Tax=Pseudoalteromonas luteoviolacea TaxID=43657 RepID=UPI001B3818D7|nr:Nif3-like dinuclear metal center hexameric protein [Pseudoalteromonas luteoviolacea]MBQ4813004.1 Nif3-like dinuclear metal center hexameric protein [Pseudoalteromonas luteoviolacea]